jgi:hypothetical protein
MYINRLILVVDYKAIEVRSKRMEIKKELQSFLFTIECGWMIERKYLYRWNLIDRERMCYSMMGAIGDQKAANVEWHRLCATLA